jgi:GxxExxY protein
MTEISPQLDGLARQVVDAAYHLHLKVGPGLLESAYEALLADGLSRRGLKVDRQKPIHVRIDDIELPDAFRVDLLVDDILLVELKSIESLAPVHSRQVLTYLRLMNLPLGLLINFNTALFRDGVKRIIDNRPRGAFASWRETNLPPNSDDAR